MRKKVNNFSGNVPTWLAIADLNIDYYTQFIKSWIPFNAWYTVSYFSETLDSDRKIIDKIKETSNPYRDRIINLLRGDDNTSSQFRYFVSQLHIELEGHSIPNHEKRISFSSINIKRNTKTQHTHSYRSFSYKVDFNPSAPKTTKRLKCEILNKKTFSNVYLDDFYDYSIDDLIKSEKYIALSPESREQLRLCYEEINPYKPENIVIKPNRNKKGVYIKPTRCTIMDEGSNIYFDENHELVSKVIIETLYLLRCVLFHGEINPTETNQSIYEQAYQIQKILIQELK